MLPLSSSVRPATTHMAYSEFIDQLVAETRLQSVLADRLSRGSAFRHPGGDSKFNRLLESLSAEQRHLVAEVLMEERHSAIHDVLAVMSWWSSSRGLSFMAEGKELETGLSGMGMHGDYVGRCDGWQWPGSGREFN